MRSLLCLLLGSIAFTGGCMKAAGALSQPGPFEKRSTPEFDLAAKSPKRLLVLVEHPAAAHSEVNIKMYVTKFINALLIENVGLKAETLIPYTELATYRQDHPDFITLTPVDAAKAMGADYVMYVVIDNFGLYGLGEAGYYKANLDLTCGIYDVSAGRMVWPDSGQMRPVKVGTDTGSGSNDKVAAQLSQAAARCIIRYLYPCTRQDARVAEEIKDYSSGW